MEMNEASLQFLKDLLATPSPSGYEQPIQQRVRQYVADLADEVRTDLHGNVIAAKNVQAPVRLMFAGHCDQIGMIVSHIDDDGFLYCQAIGGWDPQQLVGQRMMVWAKDGAVAAVISRKPIHLLHRGRTQAGRQDRGPVAGHRRQEQSRGGERRARRRPGDARARTSANCATDWPAHRPWTTSCGLWVVMEAFRRAAAQKLNCASTRSRPSRRRSACVAPPPARSASIRDWALPWT